MVRVGEMKLNVGQTLVFVPSGFRRGQPTEVTVTKIGRKWADIEGTFYTDRIEIDTLHADGGKYSSPGRCYLSREEYETEKATGDAWWAFSRTIDGEHSAPEGVTAETIQNVVKQLGLEEEFRRRMELR
jgi:hypothetical protein